MKTCPKCGGVLTRPANNPKATPRCRPCRSAYERANYHKKDRAHARDVARLWRAANRERLRAKRAAWVAANRGKARMVSWRRQGINITPSEYDALFESQGGRCAICRTDKPGGRWTRFHVDHDHKYGHVRGLLCTRCNTAIERLDDSPARVRAALKYLEKHQPRLKLVKGE